jgi:ADP-heptose:LPS heptosyltransferase
MRGRYLVRSHTGFFYLAALDALLKTIPITAVERKPVSRILVGVGGHLGDAIIATTVLPAIRHAIPDAEIGIAAGSWAVPAFEGNPAIARIHRVDHWKVNRSGIGRLAKFRRSLTTRRTAISEIRAAHYEAAIDLYPFYPNMSTLFARARVPIRVGFDSGGAGRLYTTAIPWLEGPTHMADRERELLSTFIGTPTGPPRYDLPPRSRAANAAAAALLDAAGLLSRFIVIHPGTGDARKAWPLDRWAAVCRALIARGDQVAITGSGEIEGRDAARLRAQVPGVVDLCGQTTIGELRAIMARASLVIACDSAAGHLAAAEGAPLVSIMGTMADPALWAPLTEMRVAHILTVGPESVVESALRLARS